jgi:ribosomal protein S18 acetylase RimI-like enzyme
MGIHRSARTLGPGTSAALSSGEGVVLRLLEAGDPDLLTAYLEGLSEETRRRWGPHPFDRETAVAICASLDPADVLRMVAVTGEGAAARIIGYVLLKLGGLDSDRERFAKLGLPLDPDTVASLAPSVADGYQDQGVGSLLMGHVLETARRLGLRKIVLWGGVQATNERAKHFYRKWGFRKVGEFFTDKDNDDMILEL